MSVPGRDHRRCPAEFSATLLHGSADVAVEMRPIRSVMPGGTTVSVTLLAERRGARLDVEVTAEAATVICRVRQNGTQVLDRRFNAPRRGDVDLIAEAIEDSGHGPITAQTLRMAAALIHGRTNEEPRQ